MFFSGLVLRIKIQKRWTSLTDYVDFCSVLHGLQIAEYSPDPIFSEKMMGDGVAILVEGDTIYAPCDAKVAMVATTFHAVGLNLADGTELLIHIGLETVNLKGKGFTPLVKTNDEIKKGQPIMKVDLSVMKENNLELYTPLVVLNHDSHPFKDIHNNDNIEVGDDLIQFN